MKFKVIVEVELEDVDREPTRGDAAAIVVEAIRRSCDEGTGVDGVALVGCDLVGVS